MWWFRAVLDIATTKWLSSLFLVRSGFSKTATLDIWTANFELFKFVGGIPWELVLKGKGVQKAGGYLEDIPQEGNVKGVGTGCPPVA